MQDSTISFSSVVRSSTLGEITATTSTLDSDAPVICEAPSITLNNIHSAHCLTLQCHKSCREILHLIEDRKSATFSSSTIQQLLSTAYRQVFTAYNNLCGKGEINTIVFKHKHGVQRTYIPPLKLSYEHTTLKFVNAETGNIIHVCHIKTLLISIEMIKTIMEMFRRFSDKLQVLAYQK
ncbi:hypothetical protein ADUPG1_009303 [Aduncisulcus paluster]|uniref:Uncharacterized protein n=1 Tax=Aduncisulcus paluster TaxID=2918883 RepID=A0ABQ5KY05_9EUKA|nr:hypothetical protein ADUPG1_009303 [Aduncisulcus paluster]